MLQLAERCKHYCQSKLRGLLNPAAKGPTGWRPNENGLAWAYEQVECAYSFPIEELMLEVAHSLVFNAARGCLMAVAETSRSSGKSSASGANRGRRSRRAHSQSHPGIYASNRPLAQVDTVQAAIKSIVFEVATTTDLQAITATAAAAGLAPFGFTKPLLCLAPLALRVQYTPFPQRGPQNMPK